MSEWSKTIGNPEEVTCTVCVMTHRQHAYVPTSFLGQCYE